MSDDDPLGVLGGRGVLQTSWYFVTNQFARGAKRGAFFIVVYPSVNLSRFHPSLQFLHLLFFVHPSCMRLNLNLFLHALDTFAQVTDPTTCLPRSGTR